jgi:protein-disulfide isomerase
LIAVALCLVGAAVSGVLLLQHHGERTATAAVSQVCGEGQDSGCDKVNQSGYSVVFGVPLAAIGLFFYLSLIVLMTLGLLAPEVRDSAAAAALTLLVIALVVDVGLLALQAFAIKAFCVLCLLTYGLNAVAVFVLLPARRAFLALRGLSTHVEGRLLLAGWVAGSLAVAAATAGAQSTLTLRASARGRALIGIPDPSTQVPTAAAPANPTTSAASTPSAAPIAAGTEAQHYKQLAEKLQQTLDDPQKLDQYFKDKSAQEFDQAPVQSMDLTEVPSEGTVNAPVQIVEYLDFLCPPCRQLSVALDSFLPQAGNRVAIYYKNYPLDQACNPNVNQSLHPGACWLAMGGICSGYQGKYAAYQSKVMTTDVHNPGPADVIRLATEAGVNAIALEACINDPQTKQRLTAEIEEARRVGVSGTPTFFINGKKLPRIQDFVPMVDKEAQKKGSPPLPSNLR